jgi:hypothetical protein
MKVTLEQLEQDPVLAGLFATRRAEDLAQGRAEGLEEERREVLMTVIGAKGWEMTDDIEEAVRTADGAGIKRMLRVAATAIGIDDFARGCGIGSNPGRRR